MTLNRLPEPVMYKADFKSSAFNRFEKTTTNQFLNYVIKILNNKKKKK